MTHILTVFIIIITLFFLLLGVKSLLKKNFCVICMSISLTWITYLVLHRLGYFQDSVLITLLMGQSVVGVYYLVERKIKENLLIFRLPFLLSLTLVAYALISPSDGVLSAALLLIGLWFVFITIYAFQHHIGFGKFVKKIIECCRNW